MDKRPLTYAGIVIKRSVISWHGAEGLFALLSYIAIAALIFVPTVLRDRINNEIGTWVPWVAGGWLVFLILFITPFRMWRDDQQRIESLTDSKDYRAAINGLSALFDEGNNTVFNPPVMADGEYSQWRGRWADWQRRVEQHLESNFGLSEMHLFKNLVLVKQHELSGYSAPYIQQRNQVAKQLEILRDVIVRHSDRLEKWRAKNT